MSYYTPYAPCGQVSTAWLDLAACLDAPRDWFFSRLHRGKALACCHRCPVAEACLFRTLATELPWHRYGVTGATTPRQRGKIAEHLASVGLDPSGLYATEAAWWAARLLEQRNATSPPVLRSEPSRMVGDSIVPTRRTPRPLALEEVS